MNNCRRKKLLSLWVAPELKAALRARALKLDRSVSYVVQKILAETVAQSKAK